MAQQASNPRNKPALLLGIGIHKTVNALINRIQIAEHIGDKRGQILLRVVSVDSVRKPVLTEVKLDCVRTCKLYFGRR